MSDKPWTHNKESECCLCGRPLSFYESKFIEIADPHRLVCAWPPPDGCGHRDLGKPLDQQVWYYWTDG